MKSQERVKWVKSLNGLNRRSRANRFNASTPQRFNRFNLFNPFNSFNLFVALLFPLSAAFGADPDRGLWVGQVVLNYVTEVTVPLDENNNPVAPDPTTPTPTADQAQLRLILHVNGAGQTSLLKDVAVLKRVGSSIAGGVTTINLNTNSSLLTAGNAFVPNDSDAVLVTDERLYGQFPPQPAVRIASAVFDFGDSQATDALNDMVEQMAIAAANSANATSEDLTSLSGRQAAENAAKTAALAPAQQVVNNADVAEAFSQFLNTNLTAAAISAIAAAPDPMAAAANHRTAAEQLRDRSFYQDARAVAMIDAIVAAVTNGSTPPEKHAAAHNQAAVYADIADNYDRFIAGKLFGDMIAGAAGAAAEAATNGANATSIRNAVDGTNAVSAARSEALSIRVPLYEDMRASDAVELVIEAVIASAISSLTNDPPLTTKQAQDAADRAGRTALADDVRRYVISAQIPTADYTAFVRTNVFRNSPALAAEAAAKAAVAERRDNTLFTLDSLYRVAKTAAINALRDVYSEAARAVRTELSLDGDFGAGQGDARLSWAIKQTNGVPLGAAALTGTLILPANHPTNPFRHRRHPDHTVGFDVTRRIRLDFDSAPAGPLARAGFGVDRITGTYREEIVGLHKPLGPQKNIGLKVEGPFELNRVSLIDTLNAR